MEAEVNQVASDPFSVVDSNGDGVIGLTLVDFATKKVWNPSGMEVYSSVSPSLTDLGDGSYTFNITPNVEGKWVSILIHSTYGRFDGEINVTDKHATLDSISADTDTMETDLKSYFDTKETNIISEIDSNETKIDSIQNVVDQILDDTDTLEADLKTYLDLIKDHIMGLDNRDLTVLYDYLTTVKNNLTAEIDVNEGKIDIIDNIVDSILTDTGTTLPTKIDTAEFNIRGADNDDLKNISDEIGSISTDVSDNTTSILRLAAMRENYEITSVTRNSRGKPTSVTFKAYSDDAHTQLVGTYIATTTYTSLGFIETHKVEKQ